MDGIRLIFKKDIVASLIQVPYIVNIEALRAMGCERLQSLFDHMLLNICHKLRAFMTTDQTLVEEYERAQLLFTRIHIATFYDFLEVLY